MAFLIKGGSNCRYWKKVKKAHRIMKLNGVVAMGDLLSVLSLGKSKRNDLRLTLVPVNEKMHQRNLVASL